MVNRGDVDEAFFRRISGGFAGSVTAAPPRAPSGGAKRRAVAAAERDEGRKMQALEDLIVQTEIFCSIRCKRRRWSGCRRLPPCFPARKSDIRGCEICINWRIGGRKERRRQSRNAAATSSAAASTSRLRWRRSRSTDRLPRHRTRRAVTRRKRCAICRRFRRSTRRFSGNRRRERC